MAIFITIFGKIVFRRLQYQGFGIFVWNTCVFVIFYYLSGILVQCPMIVNNIFLMGWALNLSVFNCSVHDVKIIVLFCIALGILGPLIEGTYANSGFFAYRDPHVYFVPVWLCGLYLQGGLAVASGITILESLINKK
jgi:hypothetical protein